MGALVGPRASSNFGRSFMGLKMCGQWFNGCNPGTMLGKRTERMEWRHFEITSCDQTDTLEFGLVCFDTICSFL